MTQTSHILGVDFDIFFCIEGVPKRFQKRTPKITRTSHILGTILGPFLVTFFGTFWGSPPNPRPQGSKSHPREAKSHPREAKSCPREAKSRPREAQESPKGGPRVILLMLSSFLDLWRSLATFLNLSLPHLYSVSFSGLFAVYVVC